MDEERERQHSALTAVIERRSLLRGSLLAGAGIATAALIGCGSDDDDEPTGTPGGNDDEAAAGIDFPGGRGELVTGEGLPYPYNFPEPNKQPKTGGTMVVSATWDVQTVDPVVSASGGTVTVPNMTYNRLIGMSRGPDADVFQPGLEPELAKSWERSPDGLTFTFQMTDGVTWQNLPPLNGRPFIAADAAYAMNRYATEGVHRSYYVNVDSITAVDDTTLKVTMKRPVADFLWPLGSNKQTLFPKELVDNGEISKKAIGTGPMIMTEMTPGSRVTFSKNPDYWERPVLLDGFEFRIQPDHSARLAAFRSGQVDYAYSVADTLSDIEKLKDTNPDIQVNMIPSVLGVAFAFNLANPKFQDERLRQGISLAINRDIMIKIVFEDLGRIAATAPWTYVFDSEPSVEGGELGKWTRYNPAEARKMLDAAGATNLTMANVYYAYTEAANRWTQVLVDQFRDVGVTMTGGKADYTEFNSQWIGRKLPEVSSYGWATSGFDADNWFYNQVHSQSQGNRWNINDSQLDAWAEQQQVELDPAARKAIWRKMWDREMQMAYRPPMAVGLTFQVYQPWMRGIRWTGTAPGDNASYYSWGSQVAHGWLDK
ncbi:MAG: ABC transporter substrate-binding protein [Dehalococcoidia bacterium]